MQLMPGTQRDLGVSDTQDRHAGRTEVPHVARHHGQAV